MFKKLFCVIVCMLVLCSCQEKPAETTAEVFEEESFIELENGKTRPGFYYTNKLTQNAADPFILKEGDLYYLYCTGGSKFNVRTSMDLTFWTEQSTPILKLSDTDWAITNGWAPEMYKYNDKYYFIFSAKGEDGIYSIDIAVCDTPNGEFKPLKKGTPFFAPEYSVIDGSLFFDDDGRIYMYYSKDNSTNEIKGKRVSQTYGVEIAADFSGILGEPVLISTPEQKWELKSGNTIWNEGPVVFKENGVYYLLYSANFYQSKDYAVGYASSDSPLKLFEKSENAKILAGNGTSITGPGHCNILRSPDESEIYLVYHVHTIPPTTENGRSLAIDRLVVNKDGSLSVDGPTERRRPLPSGINGYYHVNSGYTVSATGEKAEIKSLSNIESLFDGIASCRVKGIFSMEDKGSIEIKLDSPRNITNVIVYPSMEESYKPSKLDVIINDTYKLSGINFTGNDENPLFVNFLNLPKGTMIEKIKIIVHLAEGNEYAALGEVVMIERK